MMLPVWLVDNHDGCRWFVAAPMRGRARWWAAREMGGDSDDAMAMSALRIRSNGSMGGRGPQATVEADAARELTAGERLALGWRMCGRCKAVYTQEADGLCQECREGVDVDEQYADRDDVRRLARS